MASVCFYFQVHQPERLRRYSVFDAGSDYFDEATNSQIVRKVAGKCYDPATRLLLDLIRRHDGRFRVAFSVTGTVIEQFRRHAPDLIERFQALAQTGCCEFLCETYHHSLAFLYSRDEFAAQVEMHRDLVEDLFNQRPSVFRNTELIYSNELAAWLAQRGGFTGVLAEGVDALLAGRSPNGLYTPAGAPSLGLLLKNYRLSDDIAFRFSNRGWREYPLTAEKFVRWLDGLDAPAQLCNLFMDFETFGEHQWRETGIFQFLERLPGAALEAGHGFRTPSECLEGFEPVGAYDAPRMISWADTERDLSAWLGNAMQSSALHELYKLERPIKEADDPALLHDWRRLTTSDHFYYMCTKFFADGDVHKYFSPYESPYDSYINFMNVLDNLRLRIEGAVPSPAAT